MFKNTFMIKQVTNKTNDVCINFFNKTNGQREKSTMINNLVNQIE
jgi:hypothetical protein